MALDKLKLRVTIQYANRVATYQLLLYIKWMVDTHFQCPELKCGCVTCLLCIIVYIPYVLVAEYCVGEVRCVILQCLCVIVQMYFVLLLHAVSEELQSWVLCHELFRSTGSDAVSIRAGC